MKLVINMSNTFIEEYYAKGSNEVQSVLRKMWSADALAQWQFFDTKEFNTVQSMVDIRAETLNRIHRALGV